MVDRLTILAAFRLDFVARVDGCGFVERAPAALPVRCLPRARIHGLITAEDLLRLYDLVAFDAGGYQGAAPAHALGVNLGIPLVHAGVGHRADDPGGRGADRGAANSAHGR